MKESVLFNSVKYTQQLQEWYATPAGQNLYKDLLTKLDKTTTKFIWLSRTTNWWFGE